MKVSVFGWLKVWYAFESYPGEPECKSSARHMQAVATTFFKRRLFKELINLHGDRNKLQGCAFLQAHGVVVRNSKQYHFLHEYENKICLVQDWINEVDGKFSALIVRSCGTKEGIISSKKSIVIHPSVTAGIIDLVGGHAHLKLYYPGVGYCGDNYYRLRKIINSLKVA